MAVPKIYIEDAEEFSRRSKAYNVVLRHRKKCERWGKLFCLDCFGGGLTMFTKALDAERRSK